MISLDLELYWGMTDVIPLEQYKQTLIAARQAIPRILDIFERYELHATWATVGLVFYQKREDALRDAPSIWPRYVDSTLANQQRLLSVGPDELTDPYHFGHSIVDAIRAVPHQEIGTHTFSHYYCSEPGHDSIAFRADLEAAIRAANAMGVTIHSIVFPRHQIADECLAICADLGVKTYRGNVQRWAYAARAKDEQTLVMRIIRAADSYLNVTGHHTFPPSNIREAGMANVRTSHYLRPYHHRLRLLEPLKLQRIMASMTHAAQRGEVYHLWMHPEDFGQHTQKNICLLRRVADHYNRLRERYGMRSFTMHEQAVAAAAVPSQWGGSRGRAVW